MAKKATGSQKLYRNEGATQLVFEGQDINPGDEFRATLSPEQEAQLIGGGHIVILEDRSERADRLAGEAGDQPAGASVEKPKAAANTRTSRQ